MSFDHLTDRHLITAILAGQSALFRELMRRTQPLVSQIVFKMIPLPPDRADLVQDVYLKVYAGLSQFRFDAKLSTWVAQIAYNTCYHYLEKKRPHLLDLTDTANQTMVDRLDQIVPGQPTDPDVLVFSQQRTQILQQAMAQLPPLYQTLLTLYHQQELSYQEMTRITDLPEGTLKSYLFRARKALRQALTATYHPDEL